MLVEGWESDQLSGVDRRLEPRLVPGCEVGWASILEEVVGPRRNDEDLRPEEEVDVV